MIQSKNRKLFYKKFPYRATVYADWARVVRLYDLKYILNNPTLFNRRADNYSQVVYKHKTEVINALTFIECQKKEEFKYRLEHNTLNLYFVDRSLLDDIKKVFGPVLREFTEPDPDILAHLLSTQSTSVHKELPYDCRYKVYIRANMQPNIKENLKRYSTKNTDTIVMPLSLIEYLNHPRASWWGNQLYFYVKDEKMLLLIQMLISGSVKETELMITDEELAKQKEKNDTGS